MRTDLVPGRANTRRNAWQLKLDGARATANIVFLYSQEALHIGEGCHKRIKSETMRIAVLQGVAARLVVPNLETKDRITAVCQKIRELLSKVKAWNVRASGELPPQGRGNARRPTCGAPRSSPAAVPTPAGQSKAIGPKMEQ